jgi:hypothetical protein
MNRENNKEFLFAVLDDLQALPIAVFGGWAEEILGLAQARPHSDVDLLLACEDFTALEAMLNTDERYTGIPEKRFSHKRAYEKNGIRIEVILVNPNTLRTTFFDHLTFTWPADALLHRSQFGGRLIPVASRAALELYRKEHARIFNTANAEQSD